MASRRADWLMAPSPTTMSIPASASMRYVNGIPSRLHASGSARERPDRSVVQQLAGELAAVERAQLGQREAILVEQVGDERLDLLVADAVDGGQHRVHREERPVVHLVLGQPVHPARRRLEREHQAALEMILRAPKLL